MKSKDKVSRKILILSKSCFTTFVKQKVADYLCALSGVYAFAVLKHSVDTQKVDVSQQINDSVSKKIAKYACPDHIQVTPIRHRPKITRK